MKKYFFQVFIFLFCAYTVCAQQNVQYSQFMLNDYGLNPALAGTSRGLMFMVGRRTQWRGFQYAPETNFATVTKDFGRKGYSRFWHGAGLSFEYDRYGMLASKAAAASYTINLKVGSKYHLSFGVAGGFKQTTLSTTLLDRADPAIQNSEKNVMIPTFVPGVYLLSKKIFAGVAVRNLYKNQLKQGGREIGTPSFLRPQAYFTFGRKVVTSGYDFIFVPALHVQTSFTALPVIHFNCMSYFRKRVGIGLTYRMHDAVSAIFQVRIFDNIIIGFAYDYTISRFRVANANSTEIMMGFSPVMSGENYDRPTGAVNCPKFEL